MTEYAAVLIIIGAMLVSCVVALIRLRQRNAVSHRERAMILGYSTTTLLMFAFALAWPHIPSQAGRQCSVAFAVLLCGNVIFWAMRQIRGGKMDLSNEQIQPIAGKPGSG